MGEILEFDKKRSRVKFCPCGKSNKDGRFVPYKGHDIYGFCHSCGEVGKAGRDFRPAPDGSISQLPKQRFKQEKPISAKFDGRVKLDVDTSLLTEINTYDSTASGILHYHSLRSLVERLNAFKRTGGKDTNPAILKGIYQGGTSGGNCVKPSNLLAFDIDVKRATDTKPAENEQLFNFEVNNSVFQVLQEIAVLVWRSNSGNGIAGLVWVNGLNLISDTSEHRKQAMAVYELLTKYVRHKTGVTVTFDPQQGKFRQIRYLAEQKEPRQLNPTPTNVSTFVDRDKKSTIDFDSFKTTLTSENNFVEFLHSIFDAETVKALQAKYFIGSSNYRWDRSAVFWQVDINGQIRTAQIIDYNPKTGKRVKDPRSHVDWIHNALNLSDFKPSKCLFGEHLLQDNTKPVAVVESEKTAIIYSVRRPEFVWVACCGKSGLTSEKMKVLKGRTVTLFPDNDGYKLWQDAQKYLPSGIKFTKVSDLLEKEAKGEERGFDLADRYIRIIKEAKQLFTIAATVVPTEDQQTKQQIIEAIRKETNVSLERAIEGFDKMVRKGAILPTLNPNLFYLHGSTPF